MRIAIVTPYSWSYPGGVNRHVEALAEALVARGHELRVLAPWDEPGRINRALHRADPRPPSRPDYLVPLGPTVGIGANGAVSNVSPFPSGVTAMRRELRAFGPDVVHVHEPPAPLLSWDACSYPDAPVVGTFHAYATKPVPNHLASLLGARRKFNQLRMRIAVSEAAAWTGRRWFGGAYEIIPNGVDVDAPTREPKSDSGELRILFVGRPDERKGMPVLLQAFEALVEHVPARLTVVGAGPEEVRRYVHDRDAERRIDALGQLPHGDPFWRRLYEADVLCAPSLSGESFGMILTEAFAAGTPVIASNIAGYADVVTDGVDGVLVPPADPQRLAEELQALHHEPDRRAAMGAAARRSAQRYAWPRVAEEVERVYRHASYRPSAATGAERLARRHGIVRADGGPRRPATRLPSFDPEPARRKAAGGTLARRVGLAVGALAGVGLAALAANRIGLATVFDRVVDSDLSWILVASALMVASLMLRAVSWFQISRSALPDRPLRRRDVASATMIGVLMSATLPARLGEPARAMVLARRTGRMREALPVLLGTLVSQTAFNLVALGILGGIIVASTDLFHASSERIFVASLAPVILLLAVLAAPTAIRGNGSGRLARVVGAVRSALIKVRSGLSVFRDPRRGPIALAAQLTAWGVQVLACLALFTALGLDGQVGVGAAAAVLFAVNVTAVVPATPSNIGIFQLATVSVLTTGFDVGAANALAYGVILQAVEFATSAGLGVPALVREGVTWSDLRMRALSTSPVRLQPRGAEQPVST